MADELFVEYRNLRARIIMLNQTETRALLRRLYLMYASAHFDYRDPVYGQCTITEGKVYRETADNICRMWTWQPWTDQQIQQEVLRGS